jgi:transposase
MPRRPASLNLTVEEQGILTMWSNAQKLDRRYVDRAKVILLCEDGYSLSEVCAMTGLAKDKVVKWRARFRKDRIDGLRDRPRPGRPLAVAPRERIAVVALACTKPPDGYTRWTVSLLAEKTGIARSTVGRILKEGEIRPHKVEYWCGKSPDPEFEMKQAEIIALYLDPPDNALVISVDEKSQIQALDRTQPELPLRPGNSKRLTSTYVRHGTVSLLAALSVHTGSVEGRCVQRGSHEEFLAFLKSLYRNHPGKHLHIIVDNLSVHKHKAVREWVARRRRMTLHFTPTYSSWLNQVEIWFGILARDVLRGGVWTSTKQLIAQIMKYIKSYNEDRAHPFKWTYTGKATKNKDV